MKKLSIRVKYFAKKVISKITKYFVKPAGEGLMNFLVLFIMFIVLFKFDKDNKNNKD